MDTFLRLSLGGLTLTASLGCLSEDSARPVGELCYGENDCQSGLLCQYGRCRQPCATDRQCQTGAVCVPSADDSGSYVCTLPDEGGGSACPEGLLADNSGHCRRGCEADPPHPAPCGGAQVCSLGWCRLPGQVDGGIPGGSDAGLDAGGGPDASGDGDGGFDGGGPTPLDWLAVPGGNFQMGSNSGFPDERPVHEVTVPSFEMLRTEVTVSQYGECVDRGACAAPTTGGICNWNASGYESHPVNCVTWHQMDEFCRWAGGRLPSEAEWEYAARSGELEWTYPWGEETPTCEYAVMSDGGHGCGTGRTMAVCSKTAGNTQQGLCDMAGNVWEWVQDWYHRNYTGAPTDGSAWVDPSDPEWGRGIRGGSFDNSADNLRAADRGYDGLDFGDAYLGARCARDAP